MGKIIIIGVGSSQHEFIEKIHQQMPDAKCVHIGCNFYEKEHSEGVIHYDLLENSNLANEIFSTMHPVSAIETIRQRSLEITEEQADAIRKLLD